jgi:hypothetical protein
LAFGQNGFVSRDLSIFVCRLRRRGPIDALSTKLERSELGFGSLRSVFGQTFIDIVEENLRGLSRPDA